MATSPTEAVHGDQQSQSPDQPSRKRRRKDDDQNDDNTSDTSGNKNTSEEATHNPIVIHLVFCGQSSPNHRNHPPVTYLDPPRLYRGDNKQSALRGLHQAPDLRELREENPGVSFVVNKTYDCEAYHALPRTLSNFQKVTSAAMAARVPHALRLFLVVLAEDGDEAQPTHESIMLQSCSHDFRQAIEAVQQSQPDLLPILRGWYNQKSLTAPYLQFYHARKQLKSACDRLDPSSRGQVEVLLQYLDLYFGVEYKEADSLFERGYFTRSHFYKLFAPGDIIAMKEDSYDIAVLVLSGPESEDVHVPIKLKCGAWTFDGTFHMVEKTITIAMPHGYRDHEEIPLSALAAIPFRLEKTGLEQRLRQRGKVFWGCRYRRLVTCVAERRGFDIQVTNPRYMIDMNTYNLLHSGDTEDEGQAGNSPSIGDLEADEMNANEPPAGSFIFMLPATIKGFRFHDKKWRTLPVEHLQEVNWNRDAFTKLVLKQENKRHIRALVQNHVVNSRSADIIESKGNGLVILLHGPPGTGKTLTAESVAEFSERPLYRLTSGDIGTDHEMVEKSLEHIFYLGNIWKAVVLLDECEVFMEERVPSDLKRNALVSVFLRALEYYDGILILTSNRVGTFDEAFKSRMHLAMYYPPLEQDDRHEIWLNFINRLAEEKDENKDLKIDIKDFLNNSVSLSSYKLNGRQIRNAIETARKVALFEEDVFSSIHIRRTIKVIQDFDEYVEGTHGQTAEERAESTGIRRDPNRCTT